jgi:hypothetical protein
LSVSALMMPLIRRPLRRSITVILYSFGTTALGSRTFSRM